MSARSVLFNLLFVSFGTVILGLYMQFVDPLLGDETGAILGAVVLPVLVGVAGSLMLLGPAACRIALCGAMFPAAIFLFWALDAGELRDPESGVFRVLVALWTGALAAAAAWVTSARR